MMPGMTVAADELRVHRELIDRFCAAWLRRDVEGCLACVTDDVVYSTSAAEVFHGRDEVGAAFARALADDEDGSDTVVGVAEFFGDRAIGPWSVFCTDETGRRVELRGVDVYTFAGGMVCAKDVFRKTAVHRAE